MPLPVGDDGYVDLDAVSDDEVDAPTWVADVPALTEAVWLRVFANALDPDTPAPDLTVPDLEDPAETAWEGDPAWDDGPPETSALDDAADHGDVGDAPDEDVEAGWSEVDEDLTQRDLGD